MVARFHAQPAEPVLAIGARHVHASLILLNRCLTLWARFGINFHPIIVSVVSLEFFLPFLVLLAVEWLMRLFHALEAVFSLTGIALNITSSASREISYSLARLSCAPFSVLICLNVSLK